MTTPDPGWYDDPENPDAQRYWDGLDWTPRRQRKNTPPTGPRPSPAAPPPPPQMSPSPATPAGGSSPWEQIRPFVKKALDDGRRIWSRQPRKRKIILAVAGAVVAVVAAVILSVGGPLSAFSGGGHSDAYERGYHYGYERLDLMPSTTADPDNPDNPIGGAIEGALSGMMSAYLDPNVACTRQSWAEDIDDRADFNQGCLDGAAARAKKGE